jgi:hypothetical protein
LVAVVITGSAGGAVSTTHVTAAGAPVFPATSVAFTWNVCEPSAMLGYVFGDVHAEYVPSSAHWKVASASDVNVNVLGVELGFDGELLIVVVGPVVSTTHA